MNRQKISQFLNSMNVGIGQGVRFLISVFIEPKSDTPDFRRREFILNINIILTGFITLLIIFDLFLAGNNMQQGVSRYEIPSIIFTFALLLLAGLLIISRKGKFIAASYALILIQYTLLTYTISQWGIEIPLVILAYVIIIIISSILISTKFSFMVTGIISLTVVTVGYCEIHGLLNINTTWKSLSILIHDPIEFSMAFLLIMILSWLSNRETEKSLCRARQSEADLKMERDQLEIIVEERTRALKESQLEKVSDLYRFAEFGRLSSGLFHDLMTPLSGVIANVEQLELNPEKINESKYYLMKASAASKHMGEFLMTIKKQINPETNTCLFSLNQEIRETIDMVKYRARTAHVVIRFKENKEIQTLGNPLKFHQIILNILINAIDASENTSSSEAALVQICISKFDGQAVIKITDQGCGIPTHLVDKIFDPFFTTKSQYRGMGLGLSTTKRIVENDFHGSISVTSIESQGSTFTIFIPIQKVTKQKAA